MLTSGKTREAFDLSKEPDNVRARYGPTRFGQSCLLARRLMFGVGVNSNAGPRLSVCTCIHSAPIRLHVGVIGREVVDESGVDDAVAGTSTGHEAIKVGKLSAALT